MSKSKTLVAAVAVCVAAILAFGSLAYFTATKDVQSKFMISTAELSDEEKAAAFSITLTEPGVTAGEDVAGSAAGGYTYTNVLPGARLAKDPTVTNTGLFDAWIRVTVKISRAEAWKTALGVSDVAAIPGALFDIGGDWKQGGAAITNDELVCVYYYKDPLTTEDGGKTARLFSTVTIPGSLGAESMTAIDGFTVTLTADAIQRANTGDTAEAAFELWPNS